MMKSSMPSILLCMLLSCLLASWSYAASTPLKPDIPNIVKSLTVQLQPNTTPGVAQAQSDVTPSKIGELRIHPDTHKKPVYAGDPVVFEFIPTVDNVQFADVYIDTGEIEGQTLGCGCGQAPCKEVRAIHRYAEAGAYNVVVRYQDVPVAEKKIIIIEQYLTDKELLYKVSKRIARELKQGIKKVVAAEKSTAKAPKKFAFSSLRNANFEYDEDHPEDVEVIYSLIQALIEQRTVNDHYAILERSPQALIRLAHESLYVVDSENPGGPLTKQTKQEYGLRTKYKDDTEPFRYSIALVGVDDTRLIKNLGRLDDKNEQNYVQDENTQVGIHQTGSSRRESLLQRPFMVAQLDTADFLVVINRLEDTPVLTRTPEPGDYYDTKYDAKAIRRTATIKVNARIIDRDGQIMWSKNIAKQASDFLLPAFAPPTKQARKMKTSAEAPQSITHRVAAAATRSDNAVETDINSFSDSVTTAKN